MPMIIMLKKQCNILNIVFIGNNSSITLNVSSLSYGTFRETFLSFVQILDRAGWDHVFTSPYFYTHRWPTPLGYSGTLVPAITATYSWKKSIFCLLVETKKWGCFPKSVTYKNINLLSMYAFTKGLQCVMSVIIFIFRTPKLSYFTSWH